VTNRTLAESYIKKAIDRLDILDLLFKKGAYSDVVREAQEIVELATKGMLRAVGIEPPKFHDVGALLLEHGDKYRGNISRHLERITIISKRLRKGRELSFYGDIDLYPQRNTPRKTPGKPRKGRISWLKRQGNWWSELS
jgi:HEPN domain-containing protein